MCASSAEAPAQGLRFLVVAALPKAAAKRTPDEALFASLGLLPGTRNTALTAAQRRALTPHAARRCAWYLRHGAMYMRANAAALLQLHSFEACVAPPGDALGAAVLQQEVLAALVDAASGDAL